MKTNYGTSAFKMKAYLPKVKLDWISRKIKGKKLITYGKPNILAA